MFDHWRHEFALLYGHGAIPGSLLAHLVLYSKRNILHLSCFRYVEVAAFTTRGSTLCRKQGYLRMET